MRTLYHPGLKATITYDDAGRVRGINHLDEYREMENMRGREAAAAYVRDIAGNLGVASEALRNLDEPISYLDPRQQGMEYRFSQEKVSFDLTTYVYDQTYLNTPVWGAGITVTLKAPALVVGATNTSQQGVDTKLPSSEALERYRRLFATAERTDESLSRRQARQAQEPEIAKSDLLNDILGGAAKVATRLDNAPIPPRLISGRFFIYRYDAEGRTHDEWPMLSLSAVPNSIRDGNWYLVAELVFRLPHEGARMNWRTLVEVETNTITYVRGLSSGLTTGKIFPYDPVTSTGTATNTSDQSNRILNPHRKDKQLHNLNPATGTPLTQSLEGRWAKLVNITSPDFQPPTRPAGSNFDIWDVRTNEFAAVNAYYHVDRFFRFVEELGFLVTGPNGYFGGTQFPIEVDHRAFRPPWPDGNVVNAALIGHANGIDSVYYALADFRGGSVTGVTVANGGSGYTSPPDVSFTGGGGNGATARVKPEDVVGGAVTAVTVEQPGEGYMVAPLVKFSGGGGTGAFATAEIDALNPIGIATDWRVTLHELGGHGTLFPHIGESQFKFAHSAGDSFAMILNDYCSEWHNNGQVPDRFLFLPFVPSVLRRSDRGVAQQSVASVNVINPGSGYLTVNLAGGGVNEAKAVVKSQHVVGGIITQVTVTNPGTGYTNRPSVNFGGGGGIGATATAQIGPGGSVTGVTVTNGGSGYTSPPMIRFVGGGAAKAGVMRQHIIGGTITKVTITDPGTGYTSAPSVTISGGGGTGATATAQIAGGSLASVTVTNGGRNYNALNVTLSGGGVREAQAVVKSQHIVGGAVTKVTVTDRGRGYTWAPSVTIIGGGIGATAIAQLGTSGSVTRVTVVNRGSGYNNTSPPSVSFAGGGVAKVSVKPGDIVEGAVTKVTVAEPGTGYTSAPKVSFSGGGGTSAVATAELGTWGWGGGMDQGTDGKLGSGYFSEQILSTTMFRAYRSIGGDATSINRREFAARCMTFLMLQAIGQLSPINNPDAPADLLDALQKADATDWTSEGVFGGAYRKVLTWAFEKQNLNNGAPPSVDVYIDDGRAGEYQYVPIYWATTAIWNRRSPDGLSGHQEPALGATNYAYAKIKNRGTSLASEVIVKGYHCKPSAGLLWPTDLQPFTTQQLSAGTLRPNNTEEKTVGPFAWTPVVNAWGHDCMLMIVSANGDSSNVDKLAAGAVIEDWRLVPNDNNIAQRNVVLVPGGGGAKGLTAGLHGKGLWVRNPGRSAATIAVSVVLPPLLAKRGWRIAHDLPAGGARLNAHQQRLVVFDVQAGKRFTKADTQAAIKRDIVVTVTANDAIIGGMRYRLDPKLDMPFNERAPRSRGSARSRRDRTRGGDKRRR